MIINPFPSGCCHVIYNERSDSAQCRNSVKDDIIFDCQKMSLDM